jgi:hypothetical protein
MSEPLTSRFPDYAIVLSEDAFRSKLALAQDSRLAADALERAIASEPERFLVLAKPVSLDGAAVVYEDRESLVDIAFQIDESRQRIYFFRFSERHLRLRRTLFISYSRNDGIWLRQLRKVFEILESMGEISFWDDTQIQAGGDWQKVLEEKLAAANAAVLLVSDAFLDSEFISTVELPKILEKEPERAFWIHLSRSDVATREPRIMRFQSLSSNPEITLADLERLGESKLQDELLKIVTRLAQAISGSRAERPINGNGAIHSDAN